MIIMGITIFFCGFYLGYRVGIQVANAENAQKENNRIELEKAKFKQKKELETQLRKEVKQKKDNTVILADLD